MGSPPYTRSARGSLDGLVMGDAFGDSWFTLSGENVEDQWAARGLRPAPWRWTDDSAMAFVLFAHLTAHGEVRPGALAREFAAEYERDDGRKYGASMHEVLGRIGSGEDWRGVTTGQFDGQGSYGNGSEVGAGLRVAAGLPARTSVRRAASLLGSGWRISAPDTVPFALWCAAGHLDDLPEALWQTVRGWGDRDTTCAIAGGVVAARTGTGGVPADWLAAREALPTWSGWTPERQAPERAEPSPG